MKKVIFISLATVVVLTVLGLGAIHIFWGSQERGMTADGRMAPPASVRNAAEAPKFDPSKSAAPAGTAKAPECQLPTEFKLPTELDIATPQVPEGLAAPASNQKT